MSPAGRPVRWPWVAVASFFALAFAACAGVVVNGESLAEQVPFVIAFGMFGIVGALLLSRAPGNRIGALLLYGSCGTVISFSAGELTTYLGTHGTTEGIPVVAVALLSNAGWVIGIVPVMLFLPLLFPDGRLPSPRWRALAWALLAFVGFLVVGLVFGTEVLTGSADAVQVRNPLAIGPLTRIEIDDSFITVGLMASLAASFASILVRFRRSRGVERQQIKWVALAVLFLLASFVLSELLVTLGVDTTLVDTLVTGPAFLFLPVSIGIAVLQYRLYDLVVVVRKALVAGTLALFVILVYGAVVGAFGVVAAEGESSWTVFAIALALGLAFRPVARLARRLADRLVYGRRATPYEVLTEFSERVGDAYATDDVLGRMAQILGQGVGATGARVWLHVGGQLRPASSWPADAPPAEALEVRGDVPPAIPETFAVEVRDRGELLGALSVSAPPNDPMTPAKEKLVRDLAAQAGLVLRNVRLVEELKASQRRIVAAQDHERRRIERNIHDGAQQQLVALTVKLRLAQGLVAKDPQRAESMLEDLQAESQAALEDLRDLARGIYPPLLADKGLPAALEAQARRSLVPIELHADGVGRYPEEVEAAVYFSVLEALQNVAKYADASSARIELAEREGELAFSVRDDGRGFDPATTAHGTGLQGIADRLAALGGVVEVDSRPGGGSTVSGRIPVPRRAEAPSVPTPEPVASAVGGRA